MKQFKFDDAWTGPDKEKHILYCAALVVVVGLCFGLTIALVVGAAVAIGKELVYDAYMERGTPSLQDLVASGLGVALGALSAIILRATGGA